ncbi:phage terminase large subunit family protein [Tropicibacter sp. R15_0]|uniref:terminase gpA endonuclease subunit n=1 Tax=Tropicibacter sp. R15_0 TaxID=2821101 RepID=UPI001ADA2B2F|nr:terminase gpA endonuclease subunit [Tropicibacter sp. R15_0]MBO9467053.1 phage terminase large subunit family protein [Tropicibacter sp. R15_0]
MAKKVEALFDIEPLPPFSQVEAAIERALPTLRPRARVAVSETAPLRMIKSGGQWVEWRADVAPYMTEPMDVTTSRRFDSVVFVGPARSSKSEGLVINPIVHAILANPRVVAMFSPTSNAAKEWSEGTLDELIQNSPKLRAKLGKGKGANNTFTKKFNGGTRLTIDYPVGDKLAQRSIALCIGTDYDKFPADIGKNSEGMGEGEAFDLMRKRTEDAGSRAMTIVESSPRFPIIDEEHTPATPHEAPPVSGGVLALYNQGSRARLYWTCPHCSHEFEPRFERLEYPDEGTPEERGAAAYMLCPSGNGCAIEPSDKPDLNMSARWLHEDINGELVPLEDLKRDVATVSYWLPGPAAALASWAKLVSRFLVAEEKFEATGGEGSLKTVYNVELGLPYLPRARAVSEGLSAEVLKKAATDHAWQVAPANTAFLTAAADVQKGRFVVQVEAWTLDLERVVIDRFDLVNPPETAPNPEGRQIRPDVYGEDWDALTALMSKSYPVAGSNHALQILAVVCDLRGEPGVTPRARDYYRKMRLEHPNRFYLVMGKGKDTTPRARLMTPETAHRGKEHVARDVPNIVAGTDPLKDEVAASLMREAGGARKLNIPRLAPHEIFAEYAAERRYEKGWDKRPGQVRNEALDLSVYSLALVIVLEAEAINRDDPPNWALPGRGNLMAIDLPKSENRDVTDEQGQVEQAEPTAPAKKAGAWRVKRPKRNRGW